MALYYAQHKHTKFGRGSCLGTNEITAALIIFIFGLKVLFVQFCFSFDEGCEILL